MNEPVSRQGAEYAKAAKEREDFHFAVPRDFATLRHRVSCFDFFTPSYALGENLPPLTGLQNESGV